MAERKSAFALREGPRSQLAEGGTAVLDRGPLGELEADRQRVRAFEFYLGKITSLQITSAEELKARINQRFEAGFERQGYLAAEDAVTGLKDPQGKRIQISVDERVRVAEIEDQETLLEVFEAFGTLIDEREQAQAINFYIDKILSGTVTSSDELRARFNQTFVEEYLQEGVKNRYILARENGKEIRTAEGNYIEIDPAERFKISDLRQQQLLIDTYEEYTAALKEKQEVGGFDFYVGKILSGQITSPEELDARLNQRIRSGFTQAGLIEDENGKLFDDPNDSESYLQLSKDERFKISDPVEQKVLLELYDLKKSTRVPSEVKKFIEIYAKDGKEEDFARLRNLLAEGGELSTDRLGQFVENLGLQRRRATLKTKVYENLLSGDSDNVSKTLTDFDTKDSEDRALVIQLGVRALAVRRLRIAKDIAVVITNPSGNFEQALSAITQAFSNPDVPKDLQYGVILREALYKIELATFKDQVRQMIKLDADPNDSYRFIDGLPARIPTARIDYVAFIQDLKEKVRSISVGIGRVARLQEASEIRSQFATAGVDDALKQIASLPDVTIEDRTLRQQLFTLYKSFLAPTDPAAFDERFADEIAKTIELRLKEVFIRPDLGRNKEAFRYMKKNFDLVFRPLVESFQDDQRTKKEIERVLGSTEMKLKFIQRISELEKQRPLTDIERSYIQSVELLTFFNPYLLAVLNADQAVTSEYLRHHFDTLSRETTRGIKDGDYFPLIQIGTGPQGLVALGEVVRNNSELAGQMLIIDSGEQPGGPFEIPRGPAWKLNSANSRGGVGYALASAPNGNELKTVRAYGSPLRWYPGERIEGSSARFGSINTTVDYLPTPDQLSFKNYPTQEEFQIILSLQAAMLTQNIALKTTVVSVEPNPNQDQLGDKLVTLRIAQSDGSEKTVKITTDAVFNVTGLGEPKLGFRLEGSRAEQVIEQTKDSDGFPKILTTLPAFRVLADRSEDKKSPGGTLGLLGSGNSTDVLIEFLGRIFEGDNPNVRGVTKVYFFGIADASQRPRYAAIRDLRSRNGNENLVDQIREKVSDVGFATDEGDPSTRQLVLYNEDGNVIVDVSGKPILVDSVISAAGFTSTLEKTYAAYLKGKISIRDVGPDAPLRQLTLPTNPAVSVADFFADDPNIIILGTSSRDGFKSNEKKAQLPEEAKNALVRNGVENAVAVGFRGADTQAAVKAWLDSIVANLEPRVKIVLPSIPLIGENPINTQFVVEKIIPSGSLKIPDNIKYEDLELSPLLAYNIGRSFQLAEKFTGNLDFSLTFDRDGDEFRVKFNGGDRDSVSVELLSGLIRALKDEDFQRYALSLLGKRRRNPQLDVNIAFRRGRINAQDTYVQAA